MWLYSVMTEPSLCCTISGVTNGSSVVPCLILLFDCRPVLEKTSLSQDNTKESSLSAVTLGTTANGSVENVISLSTIGVATTAPAHGRVEGRALVQVRARRKRNTF